MQRRLERSVLPILYLEDVIVLPAGLVMKGWRLVPESFLWYIPHALAYWQRYSLYKRLTLRAFPEKLEEAMVIHHPWANNYSHWFADCLPRLLSVERYTSYPLLLPSNYQRFAWESLKALGVERILPMEPKYFYRVKWLVLPHMPWLDSLVLFYPQVQFYRERFLSLWGRSPAGKRIYLSRARATRRKVLNEEEIRPVLDRYGFLFLEAERLSLAQQVELFSQAHVLLALHGAGHMNLLWMPPGSHIIEIVSEAHTTPHPVHFMYANFSRILGHQHSVFYAATAEHSKREIFDRADVIVNPERLAAFLSEVLNAQ
ncbi:MAG: glycosyltransferase family 61 protein [Bacteroidia bacterium]|nr:glycosyltransferase family 61 protein [Bacteroidia bacterium]MDW8236055.1 glycosyltransferase family 61 protein [Bacteroidia bacterium]